MNQVQLNNPLHLPSLQIKGFRGIKSLSIPELGRVTLFAGKNAVGKTSVLESVAIFATRGLFSTLSKLQKNRDELMNLKDEDEYLNVTNIEALFYERSALENEPIVIGPLDEVNQLRIKKVPFNKLTKKQKESIERLIKLYSSNDGLPQLFTVKFKDQEIVLPWTRLQSDSKDFRLRFWNRYEQQAISSKIPCETLGTGLLDNRQIGRLWDKIALTDNENQTIEALKLIFGDKLDRVAVTVDDRRHYERRVIVKLRDHSDPVPLKSLGDGAVRLFSIALALANSRGGLLTIDEAENGIHHSVQKDFWNMILKTAYKNNIQILATTHSWDCARGFAQAAIEDTKSKGLLIRLDRHNEEIRAVPYFEEALKVAIDQGIEVR